MSVPSQQMIDFYDLTGGLNTVKSAIALQPNEARDLQDIDFFPIGGISKRGGLTIQNSGAISANASTGMFLARFSTAGGTNKLLLVNNTSLYDITSFPQTDKTNGQTITYSANNIWNFDILNDIVVAVNNVDTVLQINSSLTATTLTGIQLTTCLFVLEFRGYMLYFNCLVSGTQQYDRMYFSSIDDPTTVGATSFFDIAKKSGGDVRGAVDYKGNLYVFKRDKIVQVNYQVNRVNSSGLTFPFIEFPVPVVDGVGTMSHRSICKFTTPETHPTPGQELVFFVDQFGTPRIFDGTATVSFYSKIGYSRDTTITSLSSMDMSRAAYAFSINYPQKNKIFFFLSKTNSQQDTCWVLDYSTGFSLSRYKLAYPVNCGTLVQKSDSTWKPFIADYTGNVYEMDRGTSDNGKPIDAYYTTGDSYIQSPSLQSNWDWLKIRGQTDSGSSPITISYYVDGLDTASLTDSRSLFQSNQTTWGTTGAGGTMIWGQSTWAKTGISPADSEVNTLARTLRVKLEQATLNTTFNIEGWTLGARPMGVQQQ